MLGRQDRQLSLTDLFWRERIRRDHFAWRLDDFCRAIDLREEDFASMFASGGRPSVSPVLTLRAVIYQLESGLSDVEIEEGSAFDDRVKLALGMRRNDPPLDAVTLCRHRKRFVEENEGWAILQQSLKLAGRAGLLDEGGTQIIDSFLVEGAAATQDTITLLRKGIRLVIRLGRPLGVEPALLGVLRRRDYESPGKPDIDWADEEAKRQLLESLVADARAVIAAGRAAQFPADAERERHRVAFGDALTLLERIIEQDTETDSEGRTRLRNGVAADRVISVHDPEMGHGRKTTTKKTDGYKTTVVVTGEQYAFVSAVGVDRANVPDAQPVAALMQQQIENGRKPEQLLGDTAYGSADLRVDLAKKGIRVVAKVPPAAGQGGRFGKDAFTINLKEGWVRCPAGEVTSRAHRGKDDKKRPVVRYQFAAESCAACPLRAQCTTNSGGRTVGLHYHESVLQAARAQQQTDTFAELYPTRTRVEHVIVRMTRHGGRHARMLGQVKTLFQQQIVAAANNIKQLARLGGLPRPAPFTKGVDCAMS